MSLSPARIEKHVTLAPGHDKRTLGPRCVELNVLYASRPKGVLEFSLRYIYEISLSNHSYRPARVVQQQSVKYIVKPCNVTA